MPRSNHSRGSKGKRPEHEEIDMDAVRRGTRRTEIKRGIEYIVLTTVGANAEDGKTWICPQCPVVIQKGTNHTVAWVNDGNTENRRHFHNHCWKTFQGSLL